MPAAKLWDACRSGDISDELKLEYEKLDETITESMLSSEMQLAPPERMSKSALQIKIQSKIIYYKLLICRSQGQAANEGVLQAARENLGIKVNDKDTKEIITPVKNHKRNGENTEQTKLREEIGNYKIG